MSDAPRKKGASSAGPRVRFARLPHAEGLALPQYLSEGAAGLDLQAAVPADAPVTIAAHARALVPTGLIIELPPGFEAQVRPRSGLALKHGITVLNSPGTIDSDYRGEVGVILVNLGSEPFRISRGERIAQLVIARVEQVRIVESTAEALSKTVRGTGGFGSTGRDRAPPAAPTRRPRKR